MAASLDIPVEAKLRRGPRFRLGWALSHLPVGGRRRLRFAAWGARGIRVDVTVNGQKWGKTQRPEVRIVGSTVVVEFGDQGQAVAWLN